MVSTNNRRDVENFDKTRTIFSLLTIVVVIFLVGIYHNTDFSGYDFDSNENFVGFASSPIYYGYAVPISSIIINNNISFASSSDAVSRALDVTDDIVYRRAYISYDGYAWSQFNITPSGTSSGEWIYGRGLAGLSFTPAKLNLSSSRTFSNNTYVIVYTCSRNTTIHNWSCHDGWQIIPFNAKLNPGSPSSSVVIYAAGCNGSGSYPNMELSINNVIVASWTVTGDVLVPTYGAYSYTYNGIIDKNTVIRVNYTNDVSGSVRDLRVDKIVINGVTYESEAVSNINTGTWDGSSRCGGYIAPANEWLNCTGYIQYDLSGGTLPPSCSNDCSSSGLKQCSGTSGYMTCGNYDSDSCLEWSSVTTCPSGQTCSNNICIVSNSNNNSCTGTGTQTQQCPITNGQGQQVRSCVNNNWTAWGTCSITVCNANYDNCDSNQANGCEASLLTSASNCGRCGLACNSTQACTNGICTNINSGGGGGTGTTSACLSAGYNCGTLSGSSCGTCPTGLTCNPNNLCVSLSGKTIYVAPSANGGSDTGGDGTITKPYATLNKAWSYVSTGRDIIYMRGGTYRFGQTQTNLVSKSGSASKMIELWAYPGEKPIIDYSDQVFHKELYALRIQDTQYLYIKGIRITNVAQPTDGNLAMYGLYLDGGVNNCIFEQMETDHIGGWGVVISQQGTSSNNLFLNFDSHNNADPHTTIDTAYGWSDGFETASHGSTNNTFKGCRAWDNSDDGWDLLRSDGLYTLENCWSFHNGYHEDQVTPSAWGEGGVGYKLQGPDNGGTTQIRKILRNSIAFDNTNTGISGNCAGVDPQGAEFTNDIAYKNGNGGIEITYGGTGTVRNCISYSNTAWLYSFQGGTVTQDHNTWNGGVTVSDADFLSLDSSCLDDPRKADGSLPDCNFLKLRSDSDLINKGTPIAGIPYCGTAPDLGAFEYCP